MQVGGRGLGVHLGGRTLTTAVCGPGGHRDTAVVPAPGLAALLARVGDPVPVRTPDGPRSAAELVVAHLADAGCTGAGSVVVAVPGHWRGHRRSALDTAGAAAGLAPLTMVGSAVAVAVATVVDTDLPEPALLGVVEVGEEGTSLAVVRVTDRTVEEAAPPPAPSGWGLGDAEDTVLAAAGDRLPGGDTAADRAELREACGTAVQRLCAGPETTLTWSGGELRLDRAEWEDDLREGVQALAEHLRGALELTGVPVGALTGLVLAGPGARIPLVVETVAAAFGLVPLVPADPALAAARGAALTAAAAVERAAVRAPALPAPVEQPAPDDVGPAAPSGPRHRRPARTRDPLPRLVAVPVLAATLLLSGSGAVAQVGTPPTTVGESAPHTAPQLPEAGR